MNGDILPGALVPTLSESLDIESFLLPLSNAQGSRPTFYLSTPLCHEMSKYPVLSFVMTIFSLHETPN